MKHTICALLLLAACVDTEEPETGQATAAVVTVTPGTRPHPLIPPDIRWESGQSIMAHGYLAPSRTTHDGRITFESESFANFKGRCFRIIRPEVLSGHLSTTVLEVASALNERKCLPEYMFHNTAFQFGVRELGIQGALCDATPTQAIGRVDPRATNAQPQPCASDATRDCYNVTTFTHMMTPDPLVPEEVWSRPFRIEVSNPKTSFARIETVTALATAVSSLQNGSILEPVVSGDGRVLVYHDGRDTKYSFNPDGDPYGPCDARGFTAAKGISEMYADGRVNQIYGLARFQLRDSMNTPILAGAEVGGAYPWIDRDVNNLFITTAGASLYYQNAAGAIAAKYPVLSVPFPSAESPNPPLNQDDIRKIGDIGGRSGITAMGLWTQGKMVVLDNRLNNSDLAVLENCKSLPDATATCALDPIHDRVIQLYDDGGTRIGASNSFFINSPENTLNYDPDMRPLTPRDVVWQVAATTGTDEVAFDDYMSIRTLLFSPMNPPTDNTNGSLAKRNYRDGFDYTGTFTGEGWTQIPHVQNAAGSRHWTLPSFGLLRGGARVEPVAAGGVKGKGIWLDGNDDRIEYDVPAQVQGGDADSTPWMWSIWLNPTTALGTTPLRILRAPDTSEALLTSTSLIVRKGAVSVTIPIAAPLVPAINRWTHLTIVSTKVGTTTSLALSIDGFLLSTTTINTTALRITSGMLTVGGNVGQPGFVGWIDELKVVGRNPNPEELCNHAYGTLVGVSSGMAGYTRALNYPTSSHNAINGGYSLYSCESQVLGGAGSSGSYVCKLNRNDVRCVGRKVLIPEGALQAGVPRPATTANSFCTSCHSNSNPHLTMQTQALELRTLALEDDRRRQPMQPDPLLFGRIPAGLLGPGVPASTFNAPAAGYEIDPVTLPSGPLCNASTTTLCLMNRRFSVTVAFTNNGVPGNGQAVPHTGNTGHFWFFDASNIEVTVKILDGAGSNSRAWVFQNGLTNLPYTVTVTDHWGTAPGNVRTYNSNYTPPYSMCGSADTSSFFANASFALDAVTSPLGPPPTGGTCVPGSGRLCFLNNRFEVTVAVPSAPGGKATAAPLQTDKTGFFWFYSPDNIELLVKVIDGTAVNGKYWLFYGALTTQAYTITVRDTAVGGGTKSYSHAAGSQACGQLRTDALP